MILTIEVIALLAVIGIQLFLALAARFVMRNLSGRYNYSLGSQVNVAELLEKYNRVVGQVNVSVNAAISLPAKAMPQILLVKRSGVFEIGLYHNYFTLFQILLTKEENTIIHKASRYQLGLFILELVFLLLALLVLPAFAVVGIVIGVVLLFMSYFLEDYLRRISDEATEIAIDLLDLDKVEREHAKELSEKLRAEVFIYPFSLLMSVLRFFIPFWS